MRTNSIIINEKQNERNLFSALPVLFLQHACLNVGLNVIKTTHVIKLWQKMCFECWKKTRELTPVVICIPKLSLQKSVWNQSHCFFLKHFHSFELYWCIRNLGFGCSLLGNSKMVQNTVFVKQACTLERPTLYANDAKQWIWKPLSQSISQKQDEFYLLFVFSQRKFEYGGWFR